jgi:hypothetical protein
MTLASLSAGETAFVARADLNGADSAQIRIIAAPSATPGHVVLRSEVRKQAGNAALAIGTVDEVALPVTLAITRDPNGLHTWFLAGGAFTMQASSSLVIGDDLAAKKLFVGPAVAGDVGLQAVVRWVPAAILP